jgi:hypothetical protein
VDFPAVAGSGFFEEPNFLHGPLGSQSPAGLSFTGKSPLSWAVGTITRPDRVAAARRRRDEDRADYARAAKRLRALAAGRSKVLTRDEFLRALDLRN